MKKASEEIKKTQTIDESFKNIDKIIEQMDDEKCTIEKSLELYEKGVKLLDEVSKRVERIEKEVEVLGSK